MIAACFRIETDLYTQLIVTIKSVYCSSLTGFYLKLLNCKKYSCFKDTIRQLNRVCMVSQIPEHILGLRWMRKINIYA